MFYQYLRLQQVEGRIRKFYFLYAFPTLRYTKIISGVSKRYILYTELFERSNDYGVCMKLQRVSLIYINMSNTVYIFIYVFYRKLIYKVRKNYNFTEYSNLISIVIFLLRPIQKHYFRLYCKPNFCRRKNEKAVLIKS